MRLIKCPDPDCGAYNDEHDVACARCYTSLGGKIHAREAKKNQDKPRRQKFDDENDVDELEHKGKRK